MSSNQESEGSSSRLRFPKLSTWFRNLSGPRKVMATAVTVAGGVGAILGVINGAVTLVETVNGGAGVEKTNDGVEKHTRGREGYLLQVGNPYVPITGTTAVLWTA
jgi:hypothetical protein